MSLIDDALRRAREEAALQEAAKRPGASRWAPSHIPRRRRSAWKAAGALAAVFLAGSAAAWLFLARTPGRSVPDPVARPAAARPPAPVALPVRVVEPSPAPPRKIELPARSRARRAPERTSAAPGPAAPETSPATAAPASTPAASLPAAGLRTFVHSATLAGGQTIELGGIVYSEGNPVALINGKVVAPGGLVGDFTVVQIRPERVDFSGNGTTFSILLR